MATASACKGAIIAKSTPIVARPILRFAIPRVARTKLSRSGYGGVAAFSADHRVVRTQRARVVAMAGKDDEDGSAVGVAVSVGKGVVGGLAKLVPVGFA